MDTAEKKFATFRKFIIMPWNFMTTTVTDFEQYRYLAQCAAKVGATHLGAGGLGEKSRWEQPDPLDPYANWTMVCNSIFKCVPPPELGNAVPRDFAARNLGIIRKRCEILREYKLKGYFRGNEPFFVREEVFEAHPAWRGPRTDHPRRGRKELFAMCVDNPEVLQLYRRTMAEFLRKAPEVDTFLFKPNDEGSGYCWSLGLYNSPNGPAWCRHRNVGERVAGFIGTLLDGAKDAGVEADFYTEMNFSAVECEAIHAALKEKGIKLGMSGGGGTSCFYPIFGIPAPVGFLKSLRGLSYGSHRDTIHMSIDGTNDRPTLDLYFRLLSRFIKNPVRTIAERTKFLQELAIEQVGEKNADTLMDLWDAIHHANGIIDNLGRFYMLLSERWLTRPLVPFPLELTPEEKNYYRPFLFQAMSEEEAANPLVSQGGRTIDGYRHWQTIQRMVGGAVGFLGEAISLAADLEKNVGAPERSCYYHLVGKRLAALRCLMRTCEYVPEFQTLLERGLKHGPPHESADEPDKGYNDRRMIYNNIRAEMDNIHELIGILTEENIKDILFTARTPAEEDAFTFGPDLVDQLKKKVRIIRNHWPDYNRVFSRPMI